MQTVAQPLQRDQQDRADLHSLPDSPDAGARLLELAAEFVQVVSLPDDVEALRRMVKDQAYAVMRLCVLVDRLSERLDRLERRP
jgi:hypothetical protein